MSIGLNSAPTGEITRRFRSGGLVRCIGLILMSLVVLAVMSEAKETISLGDQISDDLGLPRLSSGTFGRREESLSISPGTAAVQKGAINKHALLIGVPDGWHVAATDPGVPFLEPTRLWIRTPVGLRLDGIEYPRPLQRRFEYISDSVSLYEGTVEFQLLIFADTALSSGHHLLHGKIRYQLCNDSLCLSATEQEFSVQLSADENENRSGESAAMPGAMPGAMSGGSVRINPAVDSIGEVVSRARAEVPASGSSSGYPAALIAIVLAIVIIIVLGVIVSRRLM